MDVLASSYPKARKAHSCDLCGLRIPKGEKYRKYGVSDVGSIQTIKNHLDCSNFMQAQLGHREWDADFDGLLEEVVERDGSAAVLAKWPGLKKQVAEAERTVASRVESILRSVAKQGGTNV